MFSLVVYAQSNIGPYLVSVEGYSGNRRIPYWVGDITRRHPDRFYFKTTFSHVFVVPCG